MLRRAVAIPFLRHVQPCHQLNLASRIVVQIRDRALTGSRRGWGGSYHDGPVKASGKRVAEVGFDVGLAGLDLDG